MMRSATEPRCNTFGQRAASLLWSLVLLVVLPCGDSVAQETTFTVAVANKTSEHPYFGRGWGEGYVVNGEQGQVLTLTRGVTYTFRMQNVPSFHPFYLTTSESGAGSNTYEEGVTNNFATGIETLTFTPSESTPDSLYYQCGAHAFMGSKIQVITATPTEPGVELPDRLILEQNHPNPFSSSTSIRFQLDRSGPVSLIVYDVTGREIKQLVEGNMSAGTHTVEWDGTDNAGKAVKSGAYLYRLQSGASSETRAMTLVK